MPQLLRIERISLRIFSRCCCCCCFSSPSLRISFAVLVVNPTCVSESMLHSKPRQLNNGAVLRSISSGFDYRVCRALYCSHSISFAIHCLHSGGITVMSWPNCARRLAAVENFLTTRNIGAIRSKLHRAKIRLLFERKRILRSTFSGRARIKATNALHRTARARAVAEDTILHME